MRANIEHTLTKLIAFPSISSDTASCRDVILFAQQELEGLGLSITTDFESNHPWLLATTQNTLAPKLLLAAHLDIVPPSTPKQLTAQVMGDKLYGRGAYDMKFAAACFIELLKSRHRELALYDIGILFTTDEEIGGRSVLKLLHAGLEPSVVILPDSAAPWVIEQRAKGIIHAQLTAKGSHGHASRPWENENAIHKLLPALEQLRQTYPSLQPEAPTLSVTIINGGMPSAINLIPANAEAFIDIRAFDRTELKKAKQTLQKVAKEYSLELHVHVDDPSLVLDKTNPYIQTFTDLITKQRGTALFADSQGASDGRHFAGYNIPCIILSPEGKGVHQADEWVSLADLEPFCTLLESYILQTDLFLANKSKEAHKLDGILHR